MVSNMMTMQRGQEMYASKLNKANMEIATGKRVNSASDDPSAIGRIERTKAQLNEAKIVQSALEDGMNRNAMMEATLNTLSSANEELASLAVEKDSPGADATAIEEQAKQLLDAMVTSMSDSDHNGTNPFTQASVSFTTSGGGTITQDTPKFNITKNADDPTTYDITLNDGTKVEGKSVSDILDSTFIKDNLTKQVSSAKSSIGTNTNVLKFRQNYEKTREEVLTKTLSNIEDADLGKATIEANIATQMMQLNQNMMASATRSMANQVGSVFDMKI